MRSIRRHLLVWLLCGLGGLVLACGAGCYFLVRGTLTRHFDAGLVEKAAALASLAETEISGIEFNFNAEAMPEYSRSERPEYFQLRSDGGRTLARSSSLDGGDLPSRVGSREDPVTFELLLPDGREGRAAGVRLPVRADSRAASPEDASRIAAWRLAHGESAITHVNVVCARDTRELSHALAAILSGLAAAGVVLALGIVLLVRRVVSTGCRPLDELARRLEGMEPSHASEGELDLPCPEELRPFTEVLRGFARRIVASIDREKHLASTIAHELRTPVAELRTVTELARRWADDEELQAKSLEEAHEIALQMDRLLRTCLRLARFHSGQGVVEMGPVDLSNLLSGLCRQIHGAAGGRKLRLEQDVLPGVTVRSDPELLELILGNLLDNAFHHAPPGSWVRVAAAVQGEAAEVVIANASDAFEEEELLLLDTPFWRREEPGSDRCHLGLGLAMVTAAAGLVGAGLRVSARDGRFEVRLALPNETIALQTVSCSPG